MYNHVKLYRKETKKLCVYPVGVTVKRNRLVLTLSDHLENVWSNELVRIPLGFTVFTTGYTFIRS